MYDKPEPPMAPDHYATLALKLDAKKLDIQQAYGKLALKYHTDKHASGEIVDASEFRKIDINQFEHLDVPLTHRRQFQEAYEILTDLEQREAFEDDFPNIYEQWQKYYRDLEQRERCSAAEAAAFAAEASARFALEEQERIHWIRLMAEREKARRAAVIREDEPHARNGYSNIRCYCGGCIQRRKRKTDERPNGIDVPTAEEYAAYLQMKADEAETRSREAQERETQERLGKDDEKRERVRKAEEQNRAVKMKVNDEHPKETARRAREERELDAQLRMAKAHVEAQQELYMCGEPDDPDTEVQIDIH